MTESKSSMAYKCSLSDMDLEVARQELNEKPEERMESVDTLRKWVLAQDHIRCPADDPAFLLLFLRAAKFSQLRARDMLTSFCRLKTDAPHWFTSIDTTTPRAQEFLDTGYILPLPKKDKKGRKIVILRMGCFDPSTWKDGKSVMLHCLLASTYLLLSDEANQVHGVTYFLDISGFSLRHKLFWGLEDIMHQCKFFQGSFPLRFKGFHCYKEGPMFDALYAMAKPFMSEKFKERLFFHGDSMGPIYEHIPADLLPLEYQPDDCTGPHAGTIREIADQLKSDLSAPAIQERLTRWSLPEWGIIRDLPPPDDVTASFRKLTVD